jgi:apolipoprotein N-acyltransferase
VKQLGPARGIILARGWRRVLTAFLAGAASTLAMAPINLWPVMFLTFPPLVWLLDGLRPTVAPLPGKVGWGDVRDCISGAFAIGWCFGFGYFLAGLYWIGSAFLVDAKTFGWLLPFAVTLLPAYLAVFTGLGLVAARLLWTPSRFRVLTLAATLSSAEWLRGHMFTGFPWNAFGYALTTPLPLAECVAIFGIWGLTFVAVAVFASPALLADVRRRSLAPLAMAGCALALLAAYGAVRLASNPTEMVDGVRLRIMQPNIPQDERFSYAAKAQIMNRYVLMSQQADARVPPPYSYSRPWGRGSLAGLPPSYTPPLSNPPTQAGEGRVREAGEAGEGAGMPAVPGRDGSVGDPSGLHGVTHLIWPESAFPFFLAREPDALSVIAGMLGPDTTLITGAARPAGPTPGQGVKHAYNSVYVIDHSGSILANYDKLHLVPFGEYLPFQDLLERAGLTQLTNVPGGFLPGTQRRKIAVPGAPDMLPLICYEAIFPAEAVPPGERPGWLLNVTNDAWFGISAGPYQHFQQARVRAIEEGLPLVRAANSGISAVVDPLGRVIAALSLGHEGVLDEGLPRAAPITIYARAGDLLFLLLVVGVIAVSLFILPKRESPVRRHHRANL